MPLAAAAAAQRGHSGVQHRPHTHAAVHASANAHASVHASADAHAHANAHAQVKAFRAFGVACIRNPKQPRLRGCVCVHVSERVQRPFGSFCKTCKKPRSPTFFASPSLARGGFGLSLRLCVFIFLFFLFSFSPLPPHCN